MLSLRNYHFAVSAAILALALVALNVVSKGPFLLSSALILDDLHLFPESIFSDLQDRSLYFWVYSKINQLLHNPAAVRISYLFILAASGITFFTFLTIWRCDKVTAALLSFIAIMAPTNAIMISFINGSYSILFFFLFSLGLVAISGSFFLGKGHVFAGWICLLAGAFLLFISNFFGTNSALLPLALLFLPWYSTPLYRSNRKRFWQMALVVSPIVLLASVLAVARVLSHPYTQMEGRIVFEISHLLTNSFILIANVFKSFYEPMLSTGVAYGSVASNYEIVLISAAFFLVVAVGLIRFSLSVKRTITRGVMGRADYGALLIPFFLIASILSIGVVAPNTRLHLWHMYLPSLFELSTVLLALRAYLERPLFIGLSAISGLIASYALVEASRPLVNSVELHEALADAVRSESRLWDEDERLIIILPRQPYLSGFNSLPTVRGSGFTRMHTGGNVYRSVAIAERRFLDATIEGVIGAFDGETSVHRIYELNLNTRKLERQEHVTDLSSLTSVTDVLDFCRTSNKESRLLWGHLPVGVFQGVSEIVWETQGFLSGDAAEIVSLPKSNDFILIEVAFDALNSIAESGLPGITTPPTPLLWRQNGLQVWHVADDQWRLTMGLVNSSYSVHGRAFAGRMLFISDCFAQFEINGETWTALGPFRTDGSLQFGKGFNSRYWEGDFIAVVSRWSASPVE